jgi:long-chain acyl-CoA synthetase
VAVAFSIAGALRERAAAAPDQVMFDWGAESITWRAFDRRSSQVAQTLAAAGVGAHDRVAFLDKNGLAYFEVAFGGAKVNSVLVAVNWRLAPPEMAHIVNDAEAKVLVVGSEFAGQLAQFEDQLTTVTKIVVAGGSHPTHQSYESWVEGCRADDPGVESGPDDVAMQLYTSGTTGLPKGVMLTNGNLGAILPELSAAIGLDGDSVSMVAMPLFHIGGSGWALAGIARGARTVIIREVDPDAILGAIEDQHVTHAFLVPAVIMFLLASPRCPTTDFSRFRCLTYGAAPITEKVLQQALDAFGCQFVQFYGLTETTGAITLLRPEEHDPAGPHPERLRSCGVPFPKVEIRIVDPATGADVPAGAVGELWTRSAQNMKGYWHDPDATAATITADGWLKTGDAGYLDGDGFVYLHDRVKDMIVSGGENVYPAEVENALMAHPGVADVAVIGVPSDKWGETVKAVVVRGPGSEVAEAELIDFARGRIAAFKCPTSIDFTDVLPRNPSGKVLKRQLREPYWRGLDRGIH